MIARAPGMAVLCLISLSPCVAHDHGSADPWLSSLHDANGNVCCAGDDVVLDPAWELAGGHYRVLVRGEWIDVDPYKLVREPNLRGIALVWPLPTTGIRCFLPGSTG